MRCEEYRDRIFDHDAKTLSHVESCSPCAKLRDTILAEGRLLSEARTPAAPSDLWSKIESQVQTRTRFGRAQRFGWMAAAAALFLTVIGAVVFRSRPSVKKEPVAPSHTTVRAKPERTMTLHVVDVPEETARAFSGIVPSYDGVDGREIVASAVAPRRSRRSP